MDVHDLAGEFWQEMVMELSPEERAAATGWLYGPMREKLSPLFAANRDGE